MNPTDYGNGSMLWMGQFAQDRMVLEDNAMLSVGMSVMDDITQQNHSMVTIEYENCFVCKFNVLIFGILKASSLSATV